MAKRTAPVLVLAMLSTCSVCAICGAQEPAKAAEGITDECEVSVVAKIRVDAGHRWLPPFGLERVGALPAVQVEVNRHASACREYFVIASRNESQTERHSLQLRRNPVALGEKRSTDNDPFFATAKLSSIPDRIVLYSRDARSGEITEVARSQVHWPELEVDALARPAVQINPVDLGAILVPNDWLLLAADQSAVIDAAAISRGANLRNATLRAWFEDGRIVERKLSLRAGKRTTTTLKVAPVANGHERATLHVSLVEGDRELWRKDIQTMIVRETPRWPAFGAVSTKLRYDAPIFMKDWKSGAILPPLSHDAAWAPQLEDVVVFLPNGSRFVFWRGASYIPFWAGSHNTGLCYEWAENLSWPKEVVDSMEPLNDKELRYSSVEIVESTASRIHVRWTYESTDFVYQTWGDQAVEDFFFYPDGFGTRVLTLASTPTSRYQLSEFIVLTPQSAFPFEVLPAHMADVLFLDGQKQAITFPFKATDKTVTDVYKRPMWITPRQVPVLFRIFQHKDDPAAAVYFHPRSSTGPFAQNPQYDQGQIVTPAYWGSHWPLGRGQVTVRALSTIADQVHSTPAHTSLGAWLPSSQEGGGWQWEVEPLSSGRSVQSDTRGQSRNMTISRWAWLIAKTDASDQALLDWAHSFSDPPSMKVTGARVDFPSYSAERRAIRLIAESPVIEVELKPIVSTVNPVFELSRAPRELTGITINDQPLAADAYKWDGATLWMKASIGVAGARIVLRFEETS